MIGKTATSGFVGNNVYNKTGKNQTRTKTFQPGATKRYYIHVQNDSNATDSFFLLGGSSGGGFSINYSSGGNNIKPGVVSGEYWLTLAPSAEKTIVMTVKANNGINQGAKRRVKVIVRSAGNSAKIDVVRAIMRV